MNTMEQTTDQEQSQQELNLEGLSWLNSKEAAIYLRKSENAIRIMVNRGYLRARRFRRRLYFRRVELERLLES